MTRTAPPSMKRRVADVLLPRTRWGDRVFHFLQFQVAHGRRPRDEVSFNDALYFVKTSGVIDRHLRRFVSDKEYLKLFVRAVVGDDYNVPTLAVLRRAEDVRGYRVPPGCVAKPTHASGHVSLVRESAEVDVGRIVSWLTLDYYDRTRERNYRGLEKKVIVEPLVFGTPDPLDFKFHCFRGEVRLIQVDVDRATMHSRAFFTPNFERLPFSIGYPIADRIIEAPRNLEKMITVAEQLASYFSFIRVDMYTDGERARVGELTSVHGNAHEPFFPEGAEREYGWWFFGEPARNRSLSELLTS